MDPTITTLLTVPAILALVTIARDLGVPAKLAPVLAVALGISLAVAEQQLGHLPAYQAAAAGLLLGLAASGTYDATRLVGGRPTIELTGNVIELDTGHPVDTFERTVDLSEPAK